MVEVAPGFNAGVEVVWFRPLDGFPFLRWPRVAQLAEASRLKPGRSQVQVLPRGPISKFKRPHLDGGG
jgi:hypothetical protein